MVEWWLLGLLALLVVLEAIYLILGERLVDGLVRRSSRQDSPGMSRRSGFYDRKRRDGATRRKRWNGPHAWPQGFDAGFRLPQANDRDRWRFGEPSWN